MGHLAVFEASSSVPSRKIAGGIERLGLPTAAAAYFLEHVEADAVHEHVAAHDICGSMVAADPTCATTSCSAPRRACTSTRCPGWICWTLDRAGAGVVTNEPHGPDLRVRPCADGPLLVRGAEHVTDAEGASTASPAPSSRVCACGKSQRQPWCDSTHKAIPAS